MEPTVQPPLIDVQPDFNESLMTVDSGGLGVEEFTSGMAFLPVLIDTQPDALIPQMTVT